MTDKITIDRAVLEQALEALEHHVGQTRPIYKTTMAIEALIAALEQPQVEQEPYAWMSVGGTIWRHKTCADDVPLYTHPQPPRQPLTEDGIKQAFLAAGLFEAGDELVGYEVDIARAIEAAHGIGGEQE